MKVSNFKISKYLIAKEYIGGLEIADSFLRFVLFDPVKKDKIIFVLINF